MKIEVPNASELLSTAAIRKNIASFLIEGVITGRMSPFMIIIPKKSLEIQLLSPPNT
jgi:hypothetical protein